MLISDDYRALNAQMHRDKPKWGAVGVANADAVRIICADAGTKKLLDYGAGREKLRLALEPEGYEVTSYDPAVPGIDEPPDPHDLVVCFDVLEHVEPDCVDAVIEDIARVTKKVALISVSTIPAKRLLPDGSNPHRSLHPMAWWLGRLKQYFDIGYTKESASASGFCVIARRKAL